MQIINLSSPCQLPMNCVPYKLFVAFHYKGLDGKPLLRRLLKQAHVPYARKTHMQSSWYRGRSKGKYVYIFFYTFKLFLMGNAKTLLLVNYYKP